MSIAFKIEATVGAARAGVLNTPHGAVPTPTFLPVATQGSVKSLDPDDLKALGATILLCNTYHLYLRPGVEVVRKLGGIHSFMGWSGPILTDSGGFQGYSLGHLRKISEEGILFKSHLDGSLHMFSPESSVLYQEALGADIIMPLDVCEPYGGNVASVRASLERTNRWLLRSREAHKRGDQALFGIVQGGFDADLRRESASFVADLDPPGYAIGGLSVGEPKDLMYEMTRLTTGLLPSDRPRHLLGVGSPEDLVESVCNGIDLFDCALPTRIARNGALFVREGRVNVDTAPFKEKPGPVDEECDCYTCQHFSAAYLNHLFRARELLAYRLATIHNLRFVIRLMEELREAILRGELSSYRRAFWERYRPPDEVTRRTQREMWLRSLGRAMPDVGD